MSVDRTEVDRIARLARLRLGDEEADRLTEEMNRILEHAERLRALPAGADAPSGAGVGQDAETDDRTGGGTTRARGGASSAAGGGIEGARTAVGTPDELADGPEAFAPEWVQGFFAVPPPPGVAAEGEA